MIYNETSSPAVLPVTLQQVKEWTRVDESDAELMGLIQAATERAEVIMNRPIINREFTLSLDHFPRVIVIKKSMVQSVDSITYIDTDGVVQTLASTEYSVALGSEYSACRVSPAFNKAWQSTRDEMDAVTVTFTAGYGPDWNSVPSDIQQAIAYLVGHYYDNRNIITEFTDIIPETARDMLEGHKVYAL